jgi:hypothetical protein
MQNYSHIMFTKRAGHLRMIFHSFIPCSQWKMQTSKNVYRVTNALVDKSYQIMYQWKKDTFESTFYSWSLEIVIEFSGLNTNIKLTHL